MKPTMLIVEDDQGLRPSLKRFFARREFSVLEASTCAEAVSLLNKRNIDLILLDMKLPDGSGIDVLTEARKLDAETPAVIMTAFPDVKTAVYAMKQGASDFVIKPFELEELQLTVERALETNSLRRSVRLFKRERREKGELGEIIGQSPAMEQVREWIHKVADTDAPVLLTGETGTGKELAADAIHHLSSRSAGPLVKVNCSSFSEQLLESELFGHEKGAFTDARESRAGLFEMANGGTLFLDEIAESSPSVQAKLLRVVEGQPFRRIGGQREIHTSVRLIAATNRDLVVRLNQGAFREDLFFRLNTFQIHLPPLRERGEDSVHLARFFLQRLAASLGKGELRFEAEAEQTLRAYRWPGNVRELRNMVQRAVILSDSSTIRTEHLPHEIQTSGFVSRPSMKRENAYPPLVEMEKAYLLHIVEKVDGNLSEAARILGITRNTLKRKIRA